jgi:hypothetical protein
MGCFTGSYGFSPQWVDYAGVCRHSFQTFVALVRWMEYHFKLLQRARIAGDFFILLRQKNSQSRFARNPRTQTDLRVLPNDRLQENSCCRMANPSADCQKNLLVQNTDSGDADSPGTATRGVDAGRILRLADFSGGKRENHPRYAVFFWPQ